MEKPRIEDWLASSQIAELMKASLVSVRDIKDGLSTPLGAIATWSLSLKNVFGILSSSGCPMFLVWNCDRSQNCLSERVLIFNDAYLYLLENIKISVLSQPLLNAYWMKEWRYIQQTVKQVLATGETLQSKRKLFSTETESNSQRYFYTWSYSPIWDETGQVRGVFATRYQTTVEEITVKKIEESAITTPLADEFQDRELQTPQQPLPTPIVEASLEKTEAALKESEARFEAFMRHSPASAWITSQEGRILYLSPTYFKMFQFFQEDAVGKQIHEVYSEEFAQQFLENNHRVFQTGKAIETVETAPRLDGSIGSFLVYKFPINQISGEILLGGVAIDITERQRIEEELRLITNTLPAPIAYVDKNCCYRFNNQAYETWFGQPAASFTGKHVQEVLGDAAYEAIRPYIEQALSGQRVSFESQINDGTGKVRYVKADYVPRFNHQAEVEGLFSLLHDITDRKHIEDKRKQVEQVLRESETLYRTLSEAVPDFIWSCDVSGQVNFVNARWMEYTGLTLKDLSLEEMIQVNHPEDIPLLKEQWEIANQQGESFEAEFRHRRKDGAYRWFMGRAVPVKDDHGRVVRWIGTTTDIHDRKQAEIALRQSEERLSLAQQAAGAGLWDWNIATGQVTWSDEYYRLYGLDKTITPSYENWLASILEVDQPQVDQSARAALAQCTNLNVEFRILHPTQGIRWLTAIGQTFANAEGRPVRMTGIALDITDRKQAEAEREQSLAREKAIREAAEAAEQRARFLAKLGTTLTSSLDYEYTLSKVAQAVVPTLADWCAVDILKDDGTLERLATTHIDPAKVQWGIELHRRYPPDLSAPQGIGEVLRTGQSEYYPTISDEQIVAAARDDEHLEILREIGFSSAMLVPLKARDRTLGTISFVCAESGRSYSSDDLSLAEELARRAAIAIDNARLYQISQQSRQAAERAAERTARLQAVTAALSESLTPIQVAEVIVEQSVTALGADAALVALCNEDGTMLEIVQSVGYEDNLKDTVQQLPIHAPYPLSEVVRTKQPLWAEPLSERLNRFPNLAATYQRLPFESWMSLPLVVEGKAVGGLSLSYKKFKLIEQDDRDFALALTQQCAQAIVRAQLYAAEQKARSEAEQANRIKDEFLAVLSHELRSPLNPILGWTRLLQTRKFDESATKRALETIERNAKLQTQLIDDLLDVSRILRGKMLLNVSEVDLKTVIDAALETVQLSAEAKNISICKLIITDTGLVSGDPSRLQQIVWNLLSNAIKFTPPHGQVEILLEQVDNDAQIQVRDTGKGIKPEFLPYVFEYFRQEDGTTTRRFGGLGLGLAIVQYLTELHGGTVRAASSGEGLGATFTVLLPTSMHKNQKESQEQQQPAITEATLFPLSNFRILIVDDEADMRELTSTLLEQVGAKTKVASSAVEALDVLKEFKPDLLISDIGMPEINGYELMHQIRNLPSEQGARIPAIALTAYAGEFDRHQALSTGFQQHISKPVEPEALIRMIVTLLADLSPTQSNSYQT